MNSIPPQPVLDRRPDMRAANPSSMPAANPTNLASRPDTPAFRPPAPPPALPTTANPLQFLMSGFERVIAQVASFFKGSRKDTVDEEFQDRWEQNENANPEAFVEKQLKVQNPDQSANIGRQ